MFATMRGIRYFATCGIAFFLTLTVQAAPIRVVFFGDSLTAGFGLDPTQAFPARLEERLQAAGYAATVVNAGLSGETSAGGKRRIGWILRQPVDVLVLALGGNDVLRGLPPEDTAANLRDIIRQTRERNPEVRVLLAGMEAPPNMGPEYTEAFRELYREVAETSEATLMPFLLVGVAGEAALNQADGIHPTAEGQARIAEAMWPYLEPLVRAAQASGPVTSTANAPTVE